MSYFPNLGTGGVIPSITYGRRRRFNPGGYPGRGRFQRRTGYRVGYRNVGNAGTMLSSYDRIPSRFQHPVKGAVAAAAMGDRRDVAFHVRQSFHNGLRAGRGGGFRRLGGSRRFGRSRFRRFRRFGRRRYGGGY